MNQEELRKHDGKAIDFRVPGEEGSGHLICTREKIQIVYYRAPAQKRLSHVIELTEEMIDAVHEKNGRLSLTLPAD